jgi:hypothetical protein
MITLIKGEKLFTDQTLEVFVGGDYDERDLVPVNNVGDDFAILQCQAYFIKNGNPIDNVG